MKTQPIGPFLGIDNRLPDFDLRLNTRQISGNYLRRAEKGDNKVIGVAWKALEDPARGCKLG